MGISRRKSVSAEGSFRIDSMYAAFAASPEAGAVSRVVRAGCAQAERSRAQKAASAPRCWVLIWMLVVEVSRISGTLYYSMR